MTKQAGQSNNLASKDEPAAEQGPNPVIRDLTEEEIQRLERALGKPIERKYLIYWVSLSIRGIVQSSNWPSARQLRDDCIRMAREGRQWIRHIAAYPDIFSPREQIERDSLTKAAEAFCQSLDLRMAEASLTIKAGQRKTHAAFEAFLDNMIGIAKRTSVTPSTPQRKRSTTKKRIIKGHVITSAAKPVPPPFFQFVHEALSISMEIINSSPLSARQKAHALSILPKTEEALIKAIENRRGRVRDYKEGTIGLIEW